MCFAQVFVLQRVVEYPLNVLLYIFLVFENALRFLGVLEIFSHFVSTVINKMCLLFFRIMFMELLVFLRRVVPSDYRFGKLLEKIQFT